MDCERSQAAAVHFNGKLYVVGGFDGRNFLKTIEVYDEQTHTKAEKNTSSIPLSLLF